MAKQELTQTFRTEGAEESARQVNAFQASLEDLHTESEKLSQLQANPAATVEQLKAQTAAVGRAKQAYTELGGEVSETAFNTDAFASVLNQVNPTLGALVTGARDAARSIGDLGTKQINVSAIIAAAKKGVGEYAGTLKLLGAAGLTLLALGQVRKAWEGIKRAEEDARDAAEKFRESQSGLDTRKETIRKGVLDTFAETRPTATDAEIQKAIDQALRETGNLGTDTAGAVARATGQAAPLTADEVAFRKRQFGPGARIDEARKQLQTFDVSKSFVSGRGVAVDTGFQEALLKFVQKQFGETGDAAQKRIAEAQKQLGRQTGRLSQPGILEFVLSTQESNAAASAGAQSGQELLRALRLTAEQMERSSRAQADETERRARKTPPVEDRVNPGIT